MSLTSAWPGPRRVVIDAVKPSLEPGFALKRVLGDLISCEAHVLCDSHDLLAVEWVARLSGAEAWERIPMQALGNDVYACAWQPSENGLYTYGVEAMVHHYRSWVEAFYKKAESGQDLSVELRIGAELVDAAAERAQAAGRAHEAERLQAAARFLGDTDRDYHQRVAMAFREDIKALALAFPDRALATTLPEPRLLLVERERAVFGTWYEFFPRSCGPHPGVHGTFADAAKRLPDIAALGFNIVYLPPIHPIGRTFRKGKNNTLVAAPGDVGSPWAIGAKEGGHTAVHPELGTLDDFRAFREAAEAEGLEVALDIAFQCAPDHPWVEEHPQWFRWRPDGTVQYAENPPKKYQDILPLNFETEDWEALWQALKDVFTFWIEQGVYIFRVDNPHTKSLEFWRWCLLELKAEHPQCIFLAEAFTRPKRKYRLAKGAFTQGYTYFTWRNTAEELRAYVTELTQSPAKEFFWPNFWPNTPDILHADLQSGLRNTFIGRYVLAATLSSNIGIYGPAYELLDHEPFPGKEENNHNEKYQLKVWDPNTPGNIREEIRRINALRNTHPALQRTFNVTFVDVDNPQLLAYIKQDFTRQDQFLIIVNMDWNWKQSGFVEVPLAQLGLPAKGEYKLRDALDPQRPIYRWSGSRNYVALDPKVSPAHILHLLRD